MTKFYVLLVLLFVLPACQHSPELLSGQGGDSFSFFFESQRPVFISINDNTTGEIITTIVPSRNELHIAKIPSEFKQDLYNVNFLYDTKDSYYNYDVQVVSFRDVSPSEYRLKPNEQLSNTNQELNFTPNDQIDIVYLPPSHGYYNEGRTEFNYNNKEAPFKQYFFQLKNETDLRYHFIEDVTTATAEPIDVTTLPKVTELTNVPLEANIKSARLQILAKAAGYEYEQTMWDSYQKPLIDNSYQVPFSKPFDTYSKGYYFAQDNNISSGGFVIKGMPESISLPAYNYNVSNISLDNFKIDLVDADILMHQFDLPNAAWYIVDNVKNGVDLARPILSNEVLAAYPQLAESGKLGFTNLVYLEPENTQSYEQIVKPKRRILGYNFEFMDNYQGQFPIILHQRISHGFD